MGPFEFIILFASFIFTLALTHLLFAATRMIRHRRQLTFSWPHALWMFNALMLLIGNWISLYDFHRMETMPIAVVATGLVFSGAQYFICALVSPDFEDGETFDLKAFHAREGRTYIVAFALLVVISLASNAAAGFGAGVENWARQNLTVLAMVPAVLTPLFVRARWAQVAGPLALAILMVLFVPLYYPVLAKG
jgi:hypothetical protein